MSFERVAFDLPDPREIEAREALDAQQKPDAALSASDVVGYFDEFRCRIHQYIADVQSTMRHRVGSAECLAAVVRIMPAPDDGAVAGFEEMFPWPIAAAIYAWTSVGAYRASSGNGLLQRLSSEWRARNIVANALMQEACRTLRVGVTPQDVARFVMRYGACASTTGTPRLTSLFARFSREAQLADEFLRDCGEPVREHATGRLSDPELEDALREIASRTLK